MNSDYNTQETESTSDQSSPTDAGLSALFDGDSKRLESILETIEERRAVFERLASSDLPVAKDAQRALDTLTEVEE